MQPQQLLGGQAPNPQAEARNTRAVNPRPEAGLGFRASPVDKLALRRAACHDFTHLWDLQRECWLDSTQLGIIRLGPGRSGQRHLFIPSLPGSAPSPAPPPPHPPPACSFPQPFESLSLHCCFRFSAILAFHSCLHWLRAAAVDALQAFVFISCPFAKLEFLSLLSTLIVFFCVVAFLHRPVFPRPFIFCFLSLLPSLQSFRTTVSCSKLAPAVRWPSLFAVGPRRTTRSV